MTDPLIPNLRPPVSAPVQPVVATENMIAIIKMQQLQIAALKRAVTGVADVNDRIVLQSTLGINPRGFDPSYIITRDVVI